jgi:hypothetical protein
MQPAYLPEVPCGPPAIAQPAVDTERRRIAIGGTCWSDYRAPGTSESSAEYLDGLRDSNPVRCGYGWRMIRTSVS